MNLRTVALNVNNFSGAIPIQQSTENKLDYEYRAKKLVSWVLKQKADVIVLSEFANGTSPGNILEEKIKDEFHVFKPKQQTHKAKTNWSIVLILVSKRIPIENINQISSPQNLKPWARWIEVEINIDKQPISLLGIHASTNQDRESFRNALQNFAKRKQNYYSIIIGDFNAATNEDRSRVSKHSTENGQFLNALINSNFIDVWRNNHPKLKFFSWYNNGDLNDGRRLDYAFVSTPLSNDFLCEATYDHSVNDPTKKHVLTDHSAVTLECKSK